jgi:hypothetical protein
MAIQFLGFRLVRRHFRSLFDNFNNLRGLRDKRNVAGFNFGNAGIHSLGHKALRVWIGRVILRGYDIPRRDSFPSGNRLRFAEGGPGNRFLRRSHNCGFPFRHVLGKDFAELRPINEKETGGIQDSPVGQAAWMLYHDARSQELITRVFEGNPEGLTRDVRRHLHFMTGRTKQRIPAFGIGR